MLEQPGGLADGESDVLAEVVKQRVLDVHARPRWIKHAGHLDGRGPPEMGRRAGGAGGGGSSLRALHRPGTHDRDARLLIEHLEAEVELAAANTC